jgi:single-strand DNA-binding protein
MFQKVIISGYLGRNPEMRYTPGGQAVCDFSVATKEKWTSKEGQRQERTIWWRVTVWGKNGENCNKFLRKSSKVLVEGTMRGDEQGNPKVFQKRNGEWGASFELTALNVIFLDSRQERERQEEQYDDSEPEYTDNEDIPF